MTYLSDSLEAMLAHLRQVTLGLLDRAGYCLDCSLSVPPGAESAGRHPHVITVYFHAVVHESLDGFVNPQEGITPGFVRDFVHLMKARGYTFVTPDAILSPSRPGGNLAILSSDDGYRSVQMLLPILEEEAVPLTVFLTTEYSRTNAIYWWDQIYIAGRSRLRIKPVHKHDVRSRAERDRALRQRAIDPTATAFSDSHRLLSPEDVGRLTRNSHLVFGNHTRNHLSLPLLEDGLVEDEVEGARRQLEEWTGKTVRHFAFPYGDHDERTLDLLRRWGYRTVFTTQPGHYSIPPATNGPGMHVIPRYRLRADRSAKWQARIMSKGVTFGSRLEVRVRHWLKRTIDRLHRRRSLSLFSLSRQGDPSAVGSGTP